MKNPKIVVTDNRREYLLKSNLYNWVGENIDYLRQRVKDRIDRYYPEIW